MKKIEEMTDEELFAELDRDNDSGFQTNDLVKLARSENGPWSKPVSGEVLKKILASWLEDADPEKTAK